MKTIFYLTIMTAIMFSTSSAQKCEKKCGEETVPQWAKKVVWYQIFPERFCNGDKSNDPTLESINGSWPQDATSPWQIHPWNSDWYELQPYEKKNGKDIWYNLQRRRYGGDIQGILNKLDYLQELGITALYINPLFTAPSLHKYDGATYHHIDPYFGPDPKGDIELIKSETPDDPATWVWTSADKLFLKLVKEVHNRGMRIIIDGVFNHMGINSWAFQDVVKNQEKSKYKDWFTIKSFNNPDKGTKFDYEGWFGVKELPELREDENGIVDGPKNYIFNISKRWMDPENNGSLTAGIDGWRLDVAFCVKHPFWKSWREHIRKINPECYITAEIVDGPDVCKPYLEGDEFDAVMNYSFLYNCAEFFIDDKTGLTPSQFDKLNEQLRDAFAGGISYVQQNLNNSHDSQRMLSHIVNKDKYKIRNWGQNFDNTKGSNKNYDTRKPNSDELKIAKLMTTFQMTYVGAPYIYYGEEVGMWGANDPDCRKPMIWDDIKFDDEKYLPDQSLKPVVDKVEADKDLLEHYKKVIKIRNENEVLQLGSYKTLLVDDKKELFGFEREFGESQIIVVLNNSQKEQDFTLPVEHKEYYKELMTGKIYNVESKILNGKLEPKQCLIFKKDYWKK